MIPRPLAAGSFIGEKPRCLGRLYYVKGFMDRRFGHGRPAVER